MTSDAPFQEILSASAEKQAFTRQDTKWLRVRYDLLSRLRWNTFNPTDTIEVEDGLDIHGNEHRSPPSSHAIATEPLADSPIYTMRISSYDLNNHLGHRPDDTLVLRT